MQRSKTGGRQTKCVVCRDASADVSSLSANTGSATEADVPKDNTESQASDGSSSSDTHGDTGDDYLGDADYLYYDEADGKYYEDDGSSETVRRLGRLLVRQIASAASEATKQQKKQNNTAGIDASSTGNSSSANVTADTASGNTSTVCQWVTDTDVQNSGGGVPLAVSFHLLTGELMGSEATQATAGQEFIMKTDGSETRSDIQRAS